MSKLNPTVKKNTSKEVFDSVCLAGGRGMKAALETNIQLLRRATLANLLWEDCAYIDGESVADEIARLIPLCEPSAVADLAIECRVKQKLRHTPLFIVSEMCKYDGHRAYVSIVLPKIITRADMLTDFLAIYWKYGKRPLANQVKKGLAEAFHNFDEYQFAKYDRDAAIKLRDVMFLCHPKANDQAEMELFKKIAERNLKTPLTWEVELSAGKDKRETWTRLINEHKLGALATLRNLRNMMQAGVDKYTISKGIKIMHGDMLLPLDYMKAAQYAPEFERYIEDKMLSSYENLSKLKGNTLFIVDVSGSMRCSISDKSGFNRLACACAMAMLAANQCEKFKLVTTAGNDSAHLGAHEWIEYPVKGFGIQNQIFATTRNVGYGGIFTRQCLEWCKEQFADEKFDRIIIFSDSQDCDCVDTLPKPFGKYNYICDVSAETRGVNYKGVWTAEISGWSEHFITYIAALEGIENQFVEN